MQCSMGAAVRNKNAIKHEVTLISAKHWTSLGFVLKSEAVALYFYLFITHFGKYYFFLFCLKELFAS